MKKLFSALILIPIFISCSTSLNINFANKTEYNQLIQLKDLEGDYSTLPTIASFDSTEFNLFYWGRENLWYQLNDLYEYKDHSHSEIDSTYVRIKVIEENKINLSLHYKDQLIAENEIDGTFNKGTYHYYENGIFFILIGFGYAYSDALLRIDQSGNLIVSSKKFARGGFIFWPYVNTSMQTTLNTYKKIQ